MLVHGLVYKANEFLVVFEVERLSLLLSVGQVAHHKLAVLSALVIVAHVAQDRIVGGPEARQASLVLSGTLAH